MLPILIFFLTFIFTAIIICYLPTSTAASKRANASPPHPAKQNSHEPLVPDDYKIIRLKSGAEDVILELSNKIYNLTVRYNFMKVFLSVDNPRIWGLGPLPYESKTFHINEGVTRDQVVKMIELLASTKSDLDREAKAVDAFWEKRVRTNSDMPRDEVTRGVDMMTGWRDGKSGAAAKEVVAEAQKHFGMDDGIEAGGFKLEQVWDQTRAHGTGGGAHHCECCGRRRGKGNRGFRKWVVRVMLFCLRCVLVGMIEWGWIYFLQYGFTKVFRGV